MRPETHGPRLRAVDVVALGVVVVLLLVAGAGIDRLSRNETTGSAGIAAPTTAVTFAPSGPPADVRDDFRRPDAPDLGRAGTGQPWVPVAGTWGIRDSGATLLNAATGRVSMVVVDLGTTDGTVTATAADVGPLAGLVVRALGPSDYWAVLVDLYTQRWAVAHVAEAGPSSLHDIGTRRARAGDTLHVTMHGNRIDVAINDDPVVGATDPSPAVGTRIGFVSTLIATPGRWRDLVATATPTSATSTTIPGAPATGFGP